MNIGRNDPCPCGSGKKYKNCCFGKLDDKTSADALQDIMAEVRDKLEGGKFSSLAETQAVVDTFMQRNNSATLARFHGLSPEQMHRLLYFPFATPSLIRFAADFSQPPEAPALTLFALLVDAIGEKGLKSTAKGNLPQSFCNDAARAFWGKEKYEKHIGFATICSEMDFFEMHCLRLAAEQAGLLRKYKEKFILSVQCREKITSHGTGAIYPDLFMAYVKKFNWAYRYGHQEIPFIQQSFLFTLFLLSKYGETPRPRSFYEDIFLKAFPDLLHEIEEVSYQSVGETLRNAYFYRTLSDCAEFFGLAELQAISDDAILSCYEVKKLPLLDQFISFVI